jgi:hypothetical protein
MRRCEKMELQLKTIHDDMVTFDKRIFKCKDIPTFLGNLKIFLDEREAAE